MVYAMPDGQIPVIEADFAWWVEPHLRMGVAAVVGLGAGVGLKLEADWVGRTPLVYGVGVGVSVRGRVGLEVRVRVGLGFRVRVLGG